MAPAPVNPAVDLLQRIQCEFLEMPGLRLTEPQARRLWNLDSISCADVLRVLVDGGFLFRTSDGSFMHAQHAKTVTIRPRIPAA